MYSLKKTFIAMAATLGLLFCGALTAHDCGDFLVRLRGICVAPIDDSSYVLTPTPSVLGHLGAEEGWTAELDFSYFFTPHFAAELILATSKHDLVGKGALTGTKVGSAWVLPPTLTVQYHFLPCCCFQPYVGIGVNATLFHNKDCELSGTELHLTHSIGAAVQMGFDWMINCMWFLNFDVKFIGISTRGRLTGSTSADVDLDLNPMVIGLGIGRVF